MSEQSVDLRKAYLTLRHHLVTVSVVAVVGVAAGAALALTHPPEYSSSSLVLLPQTRLDATQTPVRDVATDETIAGSSVVLGPAGAALHPTMTAHQLAQEIQVSASTSNVLEITATGGTAAEARARAQQVAEADVAYSTSAQSSLSSAQAAALDARQKALQVNLDTVNKEIKRTTVRKQAEDPGSERGRADATALSQLTAQQAALVLQIDQVRGEKAPDGDVSNAAHIIQDASAPRRPGIVSHFVRYGAVGLGIGLVAAFIGVVTLARRDRRLRFRDEMADSLGVPVIASVGSRVPRSVAGWSTMLQTYEPGTVDAWAFRQLLRAVVPRTPAGPERGKKGGESAKKPRGSTVLVIALSDDPRGLAVGAQLASYAASVGVRTQLHAAQRHESAAALWAACHRGHGQEEVRPGLYVDTAAEVTGGGHELTVVLAVLDRHNPVLAVEPGSGQTIFAVSSGSATAEELARAAVAADDVGRELSGLIVADPDDLDRTTGRLLQHERAQQVPLPARVTGVPGTKAGGSGPSGSVRRHS